jgi:hypothetical protein
MSVSLQDDLLQEYRAERKMIYSQIEVLDPLATSLRKPAAQRLIGNGALIFSELLCYMLALTSIAFMILMNKIYPFYMLNDLFYDAQTSGKLGTNNITYLNVSVYALVALNTLLFLIIGRAVRRIRLKNKILQLAGADIKLVVSQYLQRKAAIDAIDQRHFMELPHSDYEGSVSVNDMPNAGYRA